ncbi:hypothetical protein GS891_28245 [Rhodococcus hoagii]|nr:hypothetical protein [Prescottella equi]
MKAIDVVDDDQDVLAGFLIALEILVKPFGERIGLWVEGVLGSLVGESVGAGLGDSFE